MRRTGFTIRWKERLRTFARSTAGTSSIEYAVFLAMIVGGLFVALMAMREPMSDWMSNVGTSLASSEADARPKGNRPQVDRPVRKMDDDATTMRVPRLPTMTAAGLVSLLGMVLVVRRWMQPRPVEETREPVDTVQAEKFFSKKRQRILRQLSRDANLLHESGMLVRHILTQETFCVTPADYVHDVAEMMKQRRWRHVLVCDGDRLVGVISDRDIKGRTGKYARDIMSARLLTVRTNTTVFQAISTMIAHRVSSLPVVDDGVLMGILTTTDLMMALQCTIRLLDLESRSTASAAEEAPVEVAAAAAQPDVDESNLQSAHAE